MAYRLAAGIVLLCSCRESGRQHAEDFRTLIVEQAVPLDESEQSPFCSISLQIDSLNDTTQAARNINSAIAELAFGHRASSMSHAADSFCKARIRHYRDNYAELYRTDKKFGINSDWYDHHYTLQTEHAAGRDGLLCLQLTATRYEGGVREVKDIRCVNISRTTGNIVTLDDVLKPGYEAFLPSMLQSALLDKYGCKSLEELHAQGILQHSRIYIPANYEIGDNGITFLYNADEIAPYETGSITLLVPYSQLDPILKDK